MDDKSTQIPVANGDDKPEADAVINDQGQMEAAPVATASVDQPTPTQPVMDVTPPPHDESAPAPAPAAEPVESSDVTPAPAEAAPEAETAPPETNVAPAVVTPTGAAPVTAPVKPKKEGKGLMVAIAIVLALVLASAAVLYYLKSKDDKKTADNSTNKTASTAQTEQSKVAAPVTNTDVETASKDVDTSMTTLSDADFSSEALSDAALGLQ